MLSFFTFLARHPCPLWRQRSLLNTSVSGVSAVKKTSCAYLLGFIDLKRFYRLPVYRTGFTHAVGGGKIHLRAVFQMQLNRRHIGSPSDCDMSSVVHTCSLRRRRWPGHCDFINKIKAIRNAADN